MKHAFALSVLLVLMFSSAPIWAQTMPKPSSAECSIARGAIASQVSYRADKRWKIFAWASSLLVGGIAGAAAVGRKELRAGAKKAAIVAICAITAHATFWLNLNNQKLDDALERLNRVDGLLHIDGFTKEVSSSCEFLACILSYEATLLLLALIGAGLLFLPTKEAGGVTSPAAQLGDEDGR